MPSDKDGAFSRKVLRLRAEYQARRQADGAGVEGDGGGN